MIVGASDGTLLLSLMIISPLLQPGRTALVIGHPGHELLIHGWLERTRPLVFVLTDGSGGEGVSRLPSTTRVLDATGARRVDIYGDLSDRELYSLMLDGQLVRIAALFTTLTRALIASRITCIVGDAAEGHNPTHDLCRLLVNAAVARAARQGWVIDNYEFTQVGRPDGSDYARNGHVRDSDGDSDGPRQRERITLDDEALARKLAAAMGYPEMAAEVERAINAYGTAWCQTEWFLRASSDPTKARRTRPPYYETYGAERVGQGLYSRVLRYADHVVPVINHLRDLVDSPMTED